MKLATKNLLATTLAAVGMICSANAAIVVTQSDSWVDGNNGAGDGKDNLAPVIDFDVVNTNSIFVVTLYVDAAGVAGVTNARFGDGGGIGSGDVAPDLAVSDGRVISYIFLNPTTASGLSFRATNATGGVAAILYELAGAATTLDSITSATASNSITTTTADEFIISFQGINGTLVPAVSNSSVFLGVEDIQTPGGSIVGSGSLNSAVATAPSIGSQDITWSGATVGRVALAFEVVPEPSSLALMGLGGLLIARRRRSA